MKTKNSDKITLPENFQPAGEDRKAQSVKKVLIVDDEPQICDDLNDFIRNQFPGIHIRTATEGFQAGWIARGWKPNIVLLDLMLPGIDGFHVCRIIRAFQELAHTKVIVITGRGNGQRDKSFASGAVDYLTKPLDYTMLEQILKYRLYGT